MIDESHFWRLIPTLPDGEWRELLDRRADSALAVIHECWRREDVEAKRTAFDPAAFRRTILAQAPADLKALGLTLPATRWREAVDELHRIEAFQYARTGLTMKVLALDLLARQSWIARGSPYQPWRTLDGCAEIGLDLDPIDLTEAELQAGYTLKAVTARLGDLDKREQKGLWPS
jgi:hypothetical protein